MKTINQLIVRCCIAVLLLTSSAITAANLRVHDVLMTDQVNTPMNSSGEPAATNMQLSAMGRDMVLQLKPSRLNKVADLYDMHDQSLPYFYEGIVEGDANSWARISIKDGNPTGYLFHYGKLLQLENRTHLRGLIEDSNTDSALVLIEPASSVDAAPLLDGLNLPVDAEQYAPNYELSENAEFHSDKLPEQHTRQYQRTHRKQNNRVDFSDSDNIIQNISTRKTFGTSVTRAMRIGIVVDSRFNETHQNRGLARALSIINSVDAIYQSQLGIAIIVEGIRVYDDPATDPMRDNVGSVDDILGKFRAIRNADERLPNDLTLVHLFSGHRDPNRVIGLGWISTACRLDGYDLSLSTPFPFDALLAAHEIAHNLGALHDDNPQCQVEVNKAANTLMWPELSGASTAEFSACSTNRMQASKQASCNVDNIDVGVRLRTYPSTESSRRSVIIQVANMDLYQRSTELSSTTVFPIGTVINDINAGCTVDETILTCNHGILQAQSTSSTSVSATLLNRSRDSVLSSVELLNATDVNTEDNRAVIQLLTFDETTGEAVAGESRAFDDDAAFYQNDTVRGIGSASITLLNTLLFILGSRLLAIRRRFKYCV